MIRTHTIAFLGLDEAAEALCIHPHNLSAPARAGTVPAAKVGKEWRFLDVDIAEFLRSQYPINKRETECERGSLPHGCLFSGCLCLSWVALV